MFRTTWCQQRPVAQPAHVALVDIDALRTAFGPRSKRHALRLVAADARQDVARTIRTEAVDHLIASSVPMCDASREVRKRRKFCQVVLIMLSWDLCRHLPPRGNASLISL